MTSNFGCSSFLFYAFLPIAKVTNASEVHGDSAGNSKIKKNIMDIIYVKKECERAIMFNIIDKKLYIV